jgi:DNA topoisomerase-1
VTRSSTPAAQLPGREAAREAGLRFSSDTRPGIRRRRAGKAFTYEDAARNRIDDPDTLARIRALAIPPAWTHVWICPTEAGHLQATGRDAKGRKQYRYHPQFRAHREGAKFEGLTAFARALPKIRRRVEKDLGRRGLPREKVLATVVQLLERTLVRVGNDDYARTNGSYGLTTLRPRHARVEGTRIRFRFRGKGGREHEVGLRDRRLAGVVRRCQDLPGQELFQYVDADGEVRDIRSDDVNAYLREASGADVTAKDFRTWAGTVLAYRALAAMERAGTERAARKNLLAAIRRTAGHLGNTPTVCRKSYVHPAVLDAYLDGRIERRLEEAADAMEESGLSLEPATADEEREVVKLLRRAAAAQKRTALRGRGRTRAPDHGRLAAGAA